MVNRILIRIKVVQIVYSYLKGEKDLNAAEKELFFSLEKAYELYHYLLLLMIELTDLQKRRIDTAKAKYIPSAQELNPNTRFVDNHFIAVLRNNAQLQDYVSQQKLSWINEPDFLRSLLDQIISSEIYVEYMDSDKNSFEEDKEFWKSIFKNIICPNEMLSEILEDQSLYWNDDLDTIGTFVLKTIKKQTQNDEENLLLPMFRDESDSEFAKILFRKAIIDSSKFKEMIDSVTKNWELDRIAFMDIVIMIVALAEIVSFPSIPVKVTLNEYIEIAKVYSTPKSAKFINGVLDSVVSNLKREGKITKD
ncbi:MAG: transcription antitermination factor NusB [Bacteroidales bacterium]|nr:transcription antitermination factor NusB [Bacteroidales bacterium]